MIQLTEDYYPALCRAADAEWPDEHWLHWHKYDDAHSLKYATRDADRLTPACKALIARMAGRQVPGAIFPDLSLHAAGMHWLRTGGFLRTHYDAAVHPVTGWYRRVNTILFLSECEGGELEVTGDDGKTLTVTPQAGTLVAFDASLVHQVHPVTGGDRKTLSLFWWSVAGEGVRTRAEFL